MTMAVEQEDKNAIAYLTKTLGDTERNFILNKGQTTAQLKQNHRDQEHDQTIFKEMTEAWQKSNKK